MKIEKIILQKTTDCEKIFDCLGNKNHIYCKVESVQLDNIHFVKCLYTEYCNYKLSFGQNFIYTCSTRKEIFDKYGI